MADFLAEMKEKKLFFPLEYYGVNDLASHWDVKTILDNREFFQNNLRSTTMESVDSIADFLNFFLLKKIAALEELIEYIIRDIDKEIVKEICEIANDKLKNIKKGSVIQFINSHYQEIFREEYQELLLWQITIEYILPVQTGTDYKVFEYLAKEHNYLLLDRYSDFQKLFQKNPDLFAMLFREKGLAEAKELRLDCVFSIFVSIWNGENECLKHIIAPIIENIVTDTERIVLKELCADSDSIYVTENLCRRVYAFLMQIKHPRANKFRDLHALLRKQLNCYIKEHGQVFSYEIPVGQIIDELKKDPNPCVQLCHLTHDLINSANEKSLVSRLDFPSKGMRGFMDLASTNFPTDGYFTASHQSNLEVCISIGEATVLGIWHDRELCANIFACFTSVLSLISERISSVENLAEDMQVLSAMLVPIMADNGENQEKIKPLCYGAAMFICALIEKILRCTYVYLLKDKMYVPLSSATMGTLLSPNNQEMVDIFGEYHLKHLAYYLSTVGEKKIGRNIRNSLAHWVGMSGEYLNKSLVARLLYLYTDVVNTLFWHFVMSEQYK